MSNKKTYENNPAETQGQLEGVAPEGLFKELSDTKYALDQSSIVAITDPRGTITYANDKFCEISKYTRSELIGQNHRLIKSEYHPPEFFTTMWKTIAQGNVWRDEIKNKAKDDSYYWVDTTIIPFLDELGRPYQYVAIRYDITERKRIEKELKLLNEELENRVKQRTKELEQSNTKLQQALSRLKETEQSRETFIAALTHDLRTPLVAQHRVLEILKKHEDVFPQDIAPMVSGMLNSNDDLLSIVNKLLTVYQLEAGKVEFERCDIDLPTLVQECLNEMLLLASNKSIKLNNHVSELPSIKGDSEQIKRVLINLLGNAIENIQEEGTIEFNAKVDGHNINLTISDNGPGISEEQLPYIFDRYFHAKKKDRKLGSGLGLSICKMIMDSHDAKISVTSTPGIETVFLLQFSLSTGEK